MLAMVVNDNAGRLDARVVRASIASMLAPTALVSMDDHVCPVCG